jgi:hypothetical protein
VRKVGSDTGGVDDIVESKLIDMGARLEEQRERLRGNVSRMISRDERRKEGQYSPVQCRQRHQQQLWEHIVSVQVLHGARPSRMRGRGASHTGLDHGDGFEERMVKLCVEVVAFAE